MFHTLNIQWTACKNSLMLILVSGVIIGFSLFEIISKPDAGGIWDGYVPVWLGGEGPPERITMAEYSTAKEVLHDQK